jgi:predicted RNase H-like HicB family nuclease
MRTYLGAVIKGAQGYGIMFPDVPGIITAGDTLEELAAMAKEALETQLEGLFEYGQRIPEPTSFSIEDVRREHDSEDDPLPDDEEWTELLPVTVALPPYPAWVNVSMDADVVREIDRITPDRRGFFTRAARHEIERLRKHG